jgi:hypothetical protein
MANENKMMGAGGMDIPAISREEQVMRDLPKGNVTTTDEELKRLNPNMDFRTSDQMEADKAKTLQSDMMMLQNLMKNATDAEAQEIRKMMDFVGSGFTVQQVFDLMKSFNTEGVAMPMPRQGRMPSDMGQMLDPRSVVREGEMIGRAPTDAMMGALGGIGAVPTSRNMGDAT